MTTFPNSPRLFKGGIVLIESETFAVQRTGRQLSVSKGERP